MNSANMVTDFKLQGTKLDFIRALNAHLKVQNLEPNEYSFTTCYQDAAPLPEDYRWLIAFAVEGGSEGYYVHVGAIMRDERQTARIYNDFGFCKTFDEEEAHAIAREAQRFLNAVLWN